MQNVVTLSRTVCGVCAHVGDPKKLCHACMYPAPRTGSVAVP